MSLPLCLAAWLALATALTAAWSFLVRRPAHDPRTQQDQRQTHRWGEGLGGIVPADVDQSHTQTNPTISERDHG